MKLKHIIDKVTIRTYNKRTNTYTTKEMKLSKIKGKFASFHYGGNNASY